jgi:ribonuclease BN (tRNA processing enzyme)
MAAFHPKQTLASIRQCFGLRLAGGKAVFRLFPHRLIEYVLRMSKCIRIRCLLASSSVAAALSIATPAAAQTAIAPDGANRTEIRFLGTGGGPPLRLDRSKPATLLTVDGREYLIDCGIGTMRRMLQAGIESEQIGTIFLTHLHSDHTLGLAEVMGNDFFKMSLAGAWGRIAIYGPPQTKELVDSAFNYVSVAARPFEVENPGTYRMNGTLFADPFTVHEFDRDGLVYQDRQIRVTAAENSHYALMPRMQRKTFKSYAYRIETPHGTVVLTGDTGPSASLVRLAQGADVLIAEADALNPADRDRFVQMMSARNHWTAERTRGFRAHFISEHLDTGEIGELATDAHVKSVILYHYGPRDKADESAYVAGVKQRFSGPVFAPDDLDRFCLSAGTVTPCGAAVAR